jgi:DNA-binding protein YbaB
MVDPMGDLARLRSALYAGREPRGLAAATVDGDGVVVEVTFADKVSRQQPGVVAEAVCAAVAEARSRLAAAYQALVPAPSKPPAAGGPHLLGGFTGQEEAR